MAKRQPALATAPRRYHHPHLTVADVHAAMAYFSDHREPLSPS